jgi:hypothetical protein
MHLLLRKVWTPASMLSWLPFSKIPLPMMSSVYIWGNIVLFFKLSIWQCKACVIPHFHVWANLPVTSDQRMHVDYTLNRDVTLQGIYQCFSAIMVSNLSMKIVASGNVRIWNWSVGVVCCLFLAQQDHWQKPFLHCLQPPPPVNDTNPFNLFRPREKTHRPQPNSMLLIFSSCVIPSCIPSIWARTTRPSQF